MNTFYFQFNCKCYFHVQYMYTDFLKVEIHKDIHIKNIFFIKEQLVMML